jgi:hypothetical protein
VNTYNLYDVLEIEWLDSYSDSGWKTQSEFEKWYSGGAISFIIQTVGFFLREDNDFVMLAMGHDNQSKGETGKDCVDNVFAIGKKSIRKIKVIRKAIR